MPEIDRRSFGALAAGTAASLIPAGRAGLIRPSGAAARNVAAGVSHTVTFDKYSLIVDGRRLVLWSGEFHPFRLPSPSL